MWIDRCARVLRVTPVGVISSGVTSGAQIVHDAPFVDVGMKEHWLKGFLVRGTGLEHCYSQRGAGDESGLDTVRNLIKGLAEGLQSSRKSILISPSRMTLRNQCPVVLGPVVVIVGS